MALRIIAEWQLTEALGKALQLPVVDLTAADPEPEALQKIPARLAERFDLIPMRIEGKSGDQELLIAMSDPLNRAVIRRMQDVASIPIKPALAGLSAIQRAIRDHYHRAEKSETFEDVQSLRTSRPARQKTQPWSQIKQTKKEATISRLVDEIMIMGEQPKVPDELPSESNLNEFVLGVELKVRALLHLMLKKQIVSEREFVECLKHFLDASESSIESGSNPES